MKFRSLSLLATIPFLFASCGDDEANASQAESNPGAADSPPTNPASPANTPPPSTPTSAPVANVAQLNQELIKALSFNQTDQALAAIKAGATKDAKNRYGLPVIFLAAQAGQLEVVKALIAAGADPNATIGTSFNDDGAGYAGTVDGTVLGYAAAKGHGKVMYELVVARANVNGSGPAGTTPLMQAAEAGKFAVVKWLLDAGADPRAKNKTGGTALGKVQMILNPDPERQKIIALLKAKGG